MVIFGRDICANLRLATEREWLATNGAGSYAAGTISGVFTRRYHGLLIAALKPPVARTLLLARLSEQLRYIEQTYSLAISRWAADEKVEATNLQWLESFALEGTTPVWRYAFADAQLEKRVWLQPAESAESDGVTTYIQYRFVRGSAPLEFQASALVNYRDHHHTTQASALDLQVDRLPNGLLIQRATDRHIDNGTLPNPRLISSDAPALRLLSIEAVAEPASGWVEGFYLALEDCRGYDHLDDHFEAGHFQAVLQPGQTLTIVASTALHPNLDGASAWLERQQAEQDLLLRAQVLLASTTDPWEQTCLRQLVLAADQFLVYRALPQAPNGQTVIAGYPWFTDWGRDTMIALPGLTLATGRPHVAANILRTFAQFVDQGMLPNRFPDAGEAPEYNTVDATLWYFEAVRAYFEQTSDVNLLKELFPVLRNILLWHQRGTRYNIRLDQSDGLLMAGQAGVQLTWMDAKVGDWVVTPRTGKPVEVNALWYNALCCMGEFARQLGRPADQYFALAEKSQRGFARFWNASRDYCYDVLDGSDGNDPTLRPNQIFAVSLPFSPLTPLQQRAVVDACGRALLTSHGLRSLATNEPDYKGKYYGDLKTRDAAYHQGTVWSWLLGHFTTAHLRVYADPALARSLLRPLFTHLMQHGLGSVSEVFDGDPPFTPHGCFAQAWGVGEVLRAWLETAQLPNYSAA